MMRSQQQKGQSLVEILFAIAVFTIGVVTIGYLIFDSFTSIRLKEDAAKARLLSQEGLEAARLLRDVSFDALPSGTYGLSFENGTWELFSSPSQSGKFERTLTITDASDDMKTVQSQVVWQAYGRTQTVALYTQLSNWRGKKGEGTFIEINTNNAALSASSTVLGGVAFLNQGDTDATIKELRVQWDKAATLEAIAIRSVPVFTASSSGVSSGEYIDIEDYDVGASTGYHLMDIQFNDQVEATNFLITAVFSDGSQRHAVIDLTP